MKILKNAIILLALAGCSANGQVFGYDPVIDMKGVNFIAYQRDLAECRSYADQVDVLGDAAMNIGTAAIIGAAGGAAIGALGTSAATGAALGGSIGGLVGAGNMHARQRQELIINRCLINRGYVFLG